MSGSTEAVAGEPTVETCGLCNLKVRVAPEKLLAARCPRCKGPLGDPRLEQRCVGCKALNRVPRSRLSTARCGKCKEPLLKPEAVPRDATITEIYLTVAQVFAQPRLAGRQSRPRDLVEVVDLFEDLPMQVAEAAGMLPPGEERDAIVAVAGRAKLLLPRLRPLSFEASGVIFNDETVVQFQLQEAFEHLRSHPSGWKFLKWISRSGDRGDAAAREELAMAGGAFQRLMDRLHKTNFRDLEDDKKRRREVAERVFSELTRVVESWLPRPYKLEAAVKAAMSRLRELPAGHAAMETNEAGVKDDVAVFLSITTVVLARAVAMHAVAPNVADTWRSLSTSLHKATVKAD